MWLQFILAVLLLVIGVYALWPRKPQGIPPGLWGWPVIGVLPSDKLPLAEQVKELREKHGDIISWRMGSQLLIFLCNFKLIKTAFSRPETAARPPFYSLRSFHEFMEAGITNTNGRVWLNSRRFALQQLKDLGMGKSRLEDAILKEAQYLVEDFKNHLDRPTDLPWSINVAVLNVIWQMVSGTRYDVNDEKITDFLKMIKEAGKSLDGPVNWLNNFPWLVYILPFKVRTWLGMNKIYEISRAIRIFLEEKVVKPHVKNLDMNDPKDFIDAYLVEMEKQKGDPDSTMNMKDLCHGLFDFFADGSLTTSLTIRWAVFFMAKYPETQRKAQKQIDKAVPREELPSLHHKDKLPYVEAFINEVLRMSSLAPTGGPHTNTEDMELGGYRIPKNSIIRGHLECCHRDPLYWERPHEFYPEHFIDEKGRFVLKKESFIPFSIGRRICIGESLSRMELYLILSALLQNYSFSAPDGEELSDERDPTEKVIAFPSSFKVVIKKRM